MTRLLGTSLAVLMITLSVTASAQDVVIIVETCDQLSAPPPTQLQTPIIEVPEAPVPSLAPQQYAPPQQHAYPQTAVMTDSLRLDQLRRSQPRIGGAISMMAAGFIAGMTSAWMAAIANSLDDWGCSFDCGPSEEVIGLSIMSAAAFTIAIAGVVTLIRRVGKRRRINREIRALQVAY